MQFAEHHAVLLPQAGPDDARRAGIPAQFAAGVGHAHRVQIGGNGLGRRAGAPQFLNAALELAILAGHVRIQPITARAGMGIQEKEGFVLGEQGADEQIQNQMLEDIGMVAGMKGVAIAEHGDRRLLAE